MPTSRGEGRNVVPTCVNESLYRNKDHLQEWKMSRFDFMRIKFWIIGAVCGERHVQFLMGKAAVMPPTYITPFLGMWSQWEHERAHQAIHSQRNGLLWNNRWICCLSWKQVEQQPQKEAWLSHTKWEIEFIINKLEFDYICKLNSLSLSHYEDVIGNPNLCHIKP